MGFEYFHDEEELDRHFMCYEGAAASFETLLATRLHSAVSRRPQPKKLKII
jgi:hypothetical protein